MNAIDHLLEGLLHADAYPHRVDQVELRETHISWVFLTGEFAYKVKKPVDLGFLDFTTLERRKHFCREEVRLNRRFAPGLYLDVVPITGSTDAPRFRGTGPALEYAVRMLQFPEEGLFSRLIANGKLLPSHVDDLAREVGRFHRSASAVIPSTILGSPAEIEREAFDNIRELRAVPDTLKPTMAEIERWTSSAFETLRKAFGQRRATDFVRECHGDLHLGNIVLVHDHVTLFDGIEFSEAFRWIDVMSDAAFVVMDLADRGRPDLSKRFLNAYLEVTGDYNGLRVLPWYLVFRSLVRAKVAKIRSRQPDVSADERAHRVKQVEEYAHLAATYLRGNRPEVFITHGVSGSGKTTGTNGLLESIGAIRLRSDVERKRLAGLTAREPSHSDVGVGIYSSEATHSLYQRLKSLATDVVAAGFPVIVDATFLKREQRAEFCELAATLNVPFRIIPFSADPATLRQRVQQRQSRAVDASEATLAVLDRQLETYEPLDESEHARSTTVQKIIQSWPGATIP